MNTYLEIKTTGENSKVLVRLPIAPEHMENVADWLNYKLSTEVYAYTNQSANPLKTGIL